MVKTRVDLYSLLVRNGYKLPMLWSNTMFARADIDYFIENKKLMTDEVQHKMASYNDKQWDKLVWRLNDNGHVIK